MADISSLPNPLDTDQNKDSAEFGLKVIKDCYERFRNGYGNESWAQRKLRYDYNRSFGLGKQTMQEYIDRFTFNGTLNIANLDYTPCKVAIPIINKVKDRYNQRFEKISCDAIDPFTQSKKEKAKANALFKLKNKEKIQQLQGEAGVQLEEFKDTDPQDEQELELQFGFNYKEREEIIMQNLIDLVLYDNSWSDVIKDKILDDIIHCGFAVVKTYLDENGRIKNRNVKPEDFITSYSEENDFRTWEWQGEQRWATISEIRLRYPKKISEKQLYDLAKSHTGRYGNRTDWNYTWNVDYVNALARPYDGFRVQVVELCYKTLYNLTYEINSDKYGKTVLDKTNKIKEGKEYERSKPYYVSYTGCWIVDTNHLLEWGLTKNMIKPQDNLTEIYSPYVVFMHNNTGMTNTPLIETMIPSIKMMQLLSLKTQLIIAKTVPDGYDVDITGLSDIDLGAGVGVVSPMQLMEIWLQTGVKYYKGLDDDNETKRIAPIQYNTTPYSNKLEALEQQWQSEYQKLIIIVGSNSIDSGQISNQALGAKVYQDARKQGESASNYIYNAYLNIFRRTAKLIQMRGWDILVYQKGGYDGYIQALGTDKVEYIRLEASDDFEKTNFDIKVEAILDDGEQIQFENNCQVVLAGDPTMLPDITEARRLAKTNIKYATAFLMARYNKRRKEAIEEAKINSEANTEQAIRAAQAKSEGDKALDTQQHNNKLEYLRQETEAAKTKEIVTFSSILKTKVVEGLLTQGKTIEQVQAEAPWVFAGIGLVNKTQEETLAEELEDMAMEQQMEEQEMMAQQQQMAQPQMQEQQPVM